MKSAVIPQVRVDPQFRSELESVLKQGETLSEVVAVSVKNAVEYRLVQTRFHTRGQLAWEDYQRNGATVAADAVVSKLQAKLDARRELLGG